MALTKVDKSVSSTPGIVDSSNATAITIDSSENVLIGVTSGSDPLVVSDSGASSITARFINTNADANPANIRLQKLSGSPADDDYIGMINVSGENDASEETIFQSIDFISTDVSDGTEDGVIAFRTRGAGTLAERLRITEQGFLKLSSKVSFSGTGDAGLGHHTNNYMYIYGGSAGLIHQDNSGGSNRILIRDSNSIEFELNGSQRAQFDSSGNLLVGKTSLDNSTIGTEIKFNGGLINVTNSAAQCMTINRLSSDGMLVFFQQDTNGEGSIQVSGSTVSYNGFSGNHESSGIASDTAKGTVCSTIDELDTYVSGTKEGQTRTDHAKIKVSDTVGDARVYGVLSSYSETDNKPIVASVGIGSVLVTGSCEGGDLLESNGDGTAKVQDDDIIKSKTIGKVTIGNSDTNVKLVSCVLYCG
tara:strand:- start:2 stop:1255 length:1254 start_codon:yes stop_codon:yes gene_type:complete